MSLEAAAQSVKASAPPARSAAIEVLDLTKRFGKLTAVSHLDLEVRPGEVVGFLGPNGAGKTTTIRALLGFITPTAGSAHVLGGGLGRQPELRRRVGYLPGDFRIDPVMSGADLFTWFRRLRGDAGNRRADELCLRLGLDAHRPFGSLSKGNRQKVGLVQAFMSDPDVLILDEPTSGLDPLIQREFLRMVAEAADRGAAVLFSSHVLPEVERAADRVTIIRQGQLVASGPVADLLGQVRQHLELRFRSPVPAELFDGVAGVVQVDVRGATAIVVVQGPVGPALAAALTGPDLRSVRPASDELEDLFVSIYGGTAAE